MSGRYRCYGLTLQSPLQLPGVARSASERPDVVLRAASSDQFESSRALLTREQRTRDWFAHARQADGTTYVRWQGLFEFLVSPNGRQIWYYRQPRAGPESFGVYLLGQVLSFALLARGVEALHGTVSVVDGAGVAFVGESGEGKSTLAAAMLARGYPVLTDDLVVLKAHDDRWMVQPGVPRIKLFPAVARKLLGAGTRGVAMNNGTSKLVLRLSGAQTEPRPVPLRAIYVLSRPDAMRATAPVRVEPLSGQPAFLEVIRAAFNLLVHERRRLENQFSFASRVVDSVPIRRLVYPRRLALLPGVCDLVVRDAGGSEEREERRGGRGGRPQRRSERSAQRRFNAENAEGRG